MVAGGVGLAPFATLADALRRARHADHAVLRRPERHASCSISTGSQSHGVTLELATEDGTRGDKGRVTLPLERALQRGRSDGGRHGVRLRPGADARGRGARRRHATAARAQVSVERVMGCGMGGCYSCVIPVTRRRRRPSLRAVVHRRAGVHGRRIWCGIDGLERDHDGSLRSDRVAAAHQPVHGGQRVLRLRRRVRRRGRPRVDRRRRLEGPVPQASARAIRRERIVETPSGMLNAIGLQGIGVHRYIAEKLPELRRAGRHQRRQHLRQHARRVRGAGAHPVRRRGRARARAEHLLPEHQGRRHHLRVQPARHVRRRVARSRRSRTCRSSRS